MTLSDSQRNAIRSGHSAHITTMFGHFTIIVGGEPFSPKVAFDLMRLGLCVVGNGVTAEMLARAANHDVDDRIDAMLDALAAELEKKR